MKELGPSMHLGLDTTSSVPVCIASKGLNMFLNTLPSPPASHSPTTCAAWTKTKRASTVSTTQEDDVSRLRQQVWS